MAKDPIDTSSISFTALYTGHTWVARGLSMPEFRTAKGSLYYHAMTPVEWVGKVLIGDNFRIFLEQRHRIMDARLEEAIDERGVIQVLEIACGLSPRGCRFLEARPELVYVECDLPKMAQRKQRLLEEVEGPVPEVVPINIFAEDGELSLEHVFGRFDRSEPIAVITEGLVMYFKRETMTEFWGRLVEQLERFPHGAYLHDTYLVDRERRFRNLIHGARRTLGAMARSPVSIHFPNAPECREHLQGVGFSQVDVHDPRDYYEELPIPTSGGDPLVRVVEATVGPAR